MYASIVNQLNYDLNTVALWLKNIQPKVRSKQNQRYEHRKKIIVSTLLPMTGGDILKEVSEMKYLVRFYIPD